MEEVVCAQCKIMEIFEVVDTRTIHDSIHFVPDVRMRHFTEVAFYTRLSTHILEASFHFCMWVIFSYV